MKQHKETHGISIQTKATYFQNIVGSVHVSGHHLPQFHITKIIKIKPDDCVLSNTKLYHRNLLL